MMFNRKITKRHARQVLKQHYLLFLMLCLIPALANGGLFTLPSDARSYSVDAAINTFFSTATEMSTNSPSENQALIDAREADYRAEQTQTSSQILGRNKGALASFVNKTASGAYVLTFVMAIQSIVGSHQATLVVLILGALLVVLFTRYFIASVYQVISARLFLEGRCYEKVPIQRALFLLRVRKWCHVAWVQFVTAILTFLWSLTIIGGWIKYYSYFLVPYIMAENPSIKARDAITLSRQLMYGHKWECFMLELSFIGWELLGLATLGFSNALYATPYKNAVMAEYYVILREEGQSNALLNAALLCDTFLFHPASRPLLQRTYADVEAETSDSTEYFLPQSLSTRFITWFGLTLSRTPALTQFEEAQSQRYLLAYDHQAATGAVYPTRLSPLPTYNRRRWITNLNYLRIYSLGSILLMFFTFSIVGWLWELSLHLITEGEIVNRGVLHGPWLPIYGCGGVLILLLLKRLREKPLFEFIAAITLCGIIEYSASFILERFFDGTRWWDYTGYFLNLHGRICAEGLLIFGLGGMVVVYVLAPLLDTIFCKLSKKALYLILLVLLIGFASDQLYSLDHPNTGIGITDYHIETMKEAPQ